MEQEIQQPVAAPEQSFAEYKAARNAAQNPEAEAPKAETPTEPAPVVSEAAPAVESAAAPEAATENVTQETPLKRDRSASGRAKELLAAGRVDEALKILQAAAAKGSPKAAEMLEELPEARTRKPEQQATEAQPKTDTEKRALKDFLSQYFQSHPNATYEDGVEAWYEGPGAERVLSTLENRLEQKRMKEEADRKDKERQAEYQKRMDAAREKYDDFDDVYQAGIEQAAGIPVNSGFQQAVQESDISGELLYYYSKNIGELRQLSQMSPSDAYRAVLRQELKLALPVESTATPGKPVIVPSAAPAPIAPVASGAANGKPKNPAEARSFEEYKRLRRS
jgi:hypothetical protein